MTTRGDLMKNAVVAGLGSTVLSQADTAHSATARTAEMQMPRGLTLLSLVQADDSETLGVKLSNGILDVALAGKTLNLVVPTTLDELLAHGDVAALERLIAAAKDKPEFLKHEGTIKFGRLFANPGKIVCVGLNYKAHAEEAGEKLPKVPILFNKYTNTPCRAQLHHKATPT
jgi:hypothetical protein